MTIDATALSDDRFERAKRMGWFELDKMRRSSVLLIGAGALGNEAAKNLVLSGLGRLTIVDMDRVVRSNLHRCALFTEEDARVGRAKAEALAQAARRLDATCESSAVIGPLEKLSQDDFGSHSIVVAGLDNVAARMTTNMMAAKARRPLIDGGMRATIGRVFVSLPEGACLECSTNSTHGEIASLRFACSGREDVTIFEPKLAADPVTTSVVGAIMAREAVKILHGLSDAVIKNLLYYDGMANRAEVLEVARNPACPHHEGGA